MTLQRSDVSLFIQLLNRNPKHRLGAQRDAEELKAHPFFSSIDWLALSRKQVTPPFKPNVESDESTANFDPEFTSANVYDAELTGVSIPLDENDPSGDWISASVTGGAVHTPQGPLGSDRVTPTHAQSIQIDTSRNRNGTRRSDSPPLTNSVQENFRGFTYSGEGESVIAQAAAGRLAELGNGELSADEEEAVDDMDAMEPTTDDEAEDFEHPAGRYARRGQMNGLDDDLDAMHV
jgi:serine/threonine protein kinase SCH9